ncbi:hypothetical protein CRUP_014751 [Coryphaenoides rupestris]|nr:hypothetical protein CRUP_014751 [Coryphaenoides rupestris]
MAAELNMVKSFRVSDLQTLLASMGRSKSGLKQDLVGRALRLVQTEYSPELLKNVRQLYESRFPKTSGWLAARRPEGLPVAYSSLSSSPTATPQGADYLNGISKPIAAPVTEVKLVPLPFYQNLETLLPPTELIAQNNEKLQDSQCIFELTQNQADQIRNARICYTDSIGVQEDQYPPNIAVKVNQSYCHVPGYYPSNKPGVEPRRPCRPVNITPWLHLSTASNRVTVTWGNFGKRYSVVIYLLVKMRLAVPCRVLTCGHLQCFDVVFFLQMNEKKPTWTCPVCDKPAPFELLTIDGSTSLTGKSTNGSVGTAAAGGVGSGAAVPAGGGAVVDLTLDSSSEDEEGGGAGGDSEDTEDSADSHPPKRGRYNYDKDLVTAY